jgi:serine/threonine protein kinase
MPKREAALFLDFTSDYRLLDLIGQGQFAKVYCAVHRRSGQLVAIKQTAHLSESASQEPFILSELRHANVMGCQAIAQTASGYQFVLDYCEGGTLRSHLDLNSPIALETTCSLMGDVLRGLDYIHQQAIIHGDLKPENILLTHGASGALVAKIGDFGSARFVELPNRSRKEIGSPTYAAPERFEGRSSYASDLYSVGVMLYELLLGDRPFSGNPDALRDAHQYQPVPLPDGLTAAARALFEKALHKQPERRFASAADLLESLLQLSEVYQQPESRTSQFSVVSSVAPFHARSGEPSCEQSAALRSVAQAITPWLLQASLGMVRSLIQLPQGCCCLNDKGIYLLAPERSPVQILPPITAPSEGLAIAPNGRWLIALESSAGSQNPRRSEGCLYQLKGQQLINPRPIALQGPLMSALYGDVVQMVALNSRHLLRIRTSYAQAKTYLECFTRRGQFLGQLSCPVPIAQVALSALPYQLIARTVATDAADAQVLLLNLKPFEIKHLPDCGGLQHVAALPWGYLVVAQPRSHLFDRAGNLLSQLEGFPKVDAIAALSDRQLLLAASETKNPVTKGATGSSTLFTLDLDRLDLGLIF